MSEHSKFYITLITIVLVASIIGGYVAGLVGGPNQSPSLGGSTDELWQAKGGAVIGTSGTTVGSLLYATGTPLIVTTDTQAATTTKAYDVALSGVVSGCFTDFAFSTSTPTNLLSQWPVIGSRASTTAGYVTVVLRNDTGQTSNPSITGIASTTKVIAICR